MATCAWCGSFSSRLKLAPGGKQKKWTCENTKACRKRQRARHTRRGKIEAAMHR